MPTARNTKSSDLFCANDDESVICGVQSKGLSKRAPGRIWYDRYSDAAQSYALTREVASPAASMSDTVLADTSPDKKFINQKQYDGSDCKSERIDEITSRAGYVPGTVSLVDQVVCGAGRC